MKKSLALLAGAGMGLGLLLGMPNPSHAQTAGGPASGPFADVPADHWAYQAVDTLQRAGIVIGYPDGTYGGKRAMTRYEFAVAIARLLPLINQKPDLSNYATKGDLDALRNDINSRLAANQQAIDALRALVNEFQGELERLGQDVADVRRRLDALEQRVAAVEEEQRRVKITGALDVIARGDESTSGNGVGGYSTFIDANGARSGVANSKHVLQQSDVYENFALNIRGKLTDTATANVKIEFGNYLSNVGNTATAGSTLGLIGSTFPAGVNSPFFAGFQRPFIPGNSTGADSTQTHLREAYLDAPVGLGPLGGADLQVGRVPVQFSRYMLEQVDADVYTYLYETDSGNVPMDGGKLAFKVGPVNVQGFAGKNDTIPFAQLYGGTEAFNPGLQLRPTGTIIQNHAAGFTQGAGVRATVGAPQALQLSGTLEEFGLTNDINGLAPIDQENGQSYNKLTVYGADLNGALPFGLGGLVKKGGIGVDASYGVSLQGGLKTNTGSNYRYQENDEELSLQLGPLFVKGGYQYVGPYYSAPGYWGKLGAWTNPTNVRGGVVSGSLALTRKLTLKADGEFYRAAYGSTSGGGFIDSPLQSGDKVTHYKVGLGYGLSSAYAVDLGYEQVLWDLRDNSGTLTGGTSGKPFESYLTFGLGHSFNNNASLKLLYQIVQYSDRGTGFDPVDHNGGVAIGQFEVKF
jgi:uncharacterized coiled-coil protein SlyX